MVDPIDYTSGLNNSMLTGARLGGLIGLSRQQEMENQKAAEAAAMAKQFQADWQGSFGDPQKMTALAAKYPGQMEAIKSGIGFQDEQHQQDLGNAARDLRVAMATNNPQAVGAAAMKHAGVLGTVGSSPEDIMQQFQQDPQSLAHTVEAVGMSALGPEKFYDVQQNQQKIDEAARSNRAGEALQARGQNMSYQSAMTGHNLAAQRLALDQQEFGLKVQQAQEKAQQLIDGAPKLSVNMEKSIEKSVNDSAASTNSADSMAALAQQFRQEKPTTGLFGNASNMFAKVTGTDTALRDLRIRQNALVNNQVLRFLPPGPATDRDVEIVRQGAPTDMDNPEVVARWLDAMSNLERRSAQFNDFKAEWMSANGNPGQSRNGGQVLGMDVQKGESLGSAAKRYMANNPLPSPGVTKAPQAQPTVPQQYGQTQQQAQAHTSKSGIKFTVE